MFRLTKRATPSNPPANTARVFYSSSLTPVSLAAVDESGNILRLGGFTSKDYRFIKRTFFYNGTTSYTPTSGASALGVEAIGGGGAGGGSAAGTSPTNNGVAGGGGGGGGVMYWTATNVSGAHAGTFAIGAGGLVGTAGNNPGGNGGNTIFTDNANTVVAQANGGTGGPGSGVAGTALGPVVAGGAGGTASGTPAEGTSGATWQGEDGGAALRLSIVTTGMFSGQGGASKFGSGGASLIASGAGNAGRKYGGGGSGGCDEASTTRQGGAGANGIMIVEEWA